MVIKDELLDPYYIETDTSGTFNVIHSYIGSVEGSKNYGKEITNTLGYFSSVNSALQFIINKKIQNNNEVVSLKEYKKELVQYIDDIKSLINSNSII